MSTVRFEKITPDQARTILAAVAAIAGRAVASKPEAA